MKKLLYLLLPISFVFLLCSCFNTKNIQNGNHTYSSHYNDEYHYEECDCGDIINKEAHQYEITTIYDATCEAEEKAKYTCKCGYSKEVTIPALGHKPLTVSGTPATCDNTGLSDYVICETCGKTLQAQEVLSKLNHEFSEWEEDMPATCTNKGKEKRECVHCHLEEYRDIPMKEHNYIQGESEDSTCTHHGHTADTHCHDCGHVLTPSETLPLLEHDYEYSKTLTEPTYTSKGLDEYKCKNCTSTKNVVTERLQYDNSKFKNAIKDFTNMEITYTLIDTTSNINETITLINKDNIIFAKIINNDSNEETDYYKLANNTVVENTPQGYKHNIYNSSNDLYSKYYNYINQAFVNAPGTNALTFDESTNSYYVTANLVDYKYNTQTNATTSITIDKDAKALSFTFDSLNIKIEAEINYSPSSINVPTTHYHTFNYDEECVVCGETATKYEAYKDNFIITYYVFDNGSIQYEFEMDNDTDIVPTFTEPTLYKSTEYNLVRITQTYTVDDISKTFYIYKINNTVLSEYESDNLESELDTTRVGETDNAILPDGTRAHLMYKMDSNLYIKVYKEGLSESMVVLKGNVFNISGQKGNFYIWFQNESDDKMYKLHYNFNIVITEVH